MLILNLYYQCRISQYYILYARQNRNEVVEIWFALAKHRARATESQRDFFFFFFGGGLKYKLPFFMAVSKVSYLGCKCVVCNMDLELLRLEKTA